MILLIGLGVLIFIIYTIVIARCGYMSGVNDWELTKEVLSESGHLPKYVKNEKGYWVKDKDAPQEKSAP